MSKNLTLLRMPRTAGRSLDCFLSEYYAITSKSYTLERILDQKFNKCENDFVFFFVRNPWDYWVSLFFHHATNAGANADNDMSNMLDHWFWFNIYTIDQTHNYKKHFTLFVNKIYECWLQNDIDGCLNICGYNNANDKHSGKVIMPQIIYYDTFRKHCDVDYVGKYETIHQDLDHIFKACDQFYMHAIFRLPRFKFYNKCIHKTSHKRKHYSHYYNDETRQIVINIEQDIIKKYNYEFEKR